MKKFITFVMALTLAVASLQAANSVYWQGDAEGDYDPTRRNATLMGVNAKNQEIWVVAPTGKTAAYIKAYVDDVKFDSRHSWFGASEDYKFEKGSVINSYVRNNRGVKDEYSFVRLESSTVLYIAWKNSKTPANLYLAGAAATVEAGEVKCESYRDGFEVPMTVSLAGINPAAIQKLEVKRNGTVIKTFNYTVTDGFSNGKASESFIDYVAIGAESANYEVVATPVEGLKPLVNGGTITATKSVELPSVTPVKISEVYLEKQVDGYAWGGWRAAVKWNEVHYSDIASLTLLRRIDVAKTDLLKSVHTDVDTDVEVVTIYDATETEYLDKFNNELLADNDFTITYTLRVNFTDGTSETVAASAHTDVVDPENPIHTGVGAVKVDENASKTIYTIDGVKVSQAETSNLPAGVYVVRTGKKVEKIIVK